MWTRGRCSGAAVMCLLVGGLWGCAAPQREAQPDAAPQAQADAPPPDPTPDRAGRPPTKPRPDAAIGPRVQLGRDAWDFGTVWHNDDVCLDLRITNAGDAPLTVNFGKAWALELDAAAVAAPILAGETATVGVSVRTNIQSTRADRSYGLRIRTNDPENEEIYFPIRGVVRPLYDTISASRVTLYVGTRDDEVSGALEMVNNTDEPLPLSIHSYDSAFIHVELEELEAGQRYRLNARTVPPLPVGHRVVPVVLDTGPDGRGTFVVNVSINYQ